MILLLADSPDRGSAVRQLARPGESIRKRASGSPAPKATVPQPKSTGSGSTRAAGRRRTETLVVRV